MSNPLENEVITRENRKDSVNAPLDVNFFIREQKILFVLQVTRTLAKIREITYRHIEYSHGCMSPMIIASLVLLSMSSCAFLDPYDPSTRLEITSTSHTTIFREKIEPIIHSLADSTIYFTGGTVLGSGALVAGIGWGICQLTPWASTFGNECLLASKIGWLGAKRSFAQIFKRYAFISPFIAEPSSSYTAWHNHKELLSSIPVRSQDDQELLDFLERRWLAKSTGCYTFLADWMCPSFGISLQMHPETTNSYARLPLNKFSQTYLNRVEAWKQFLPQPQTYPLILTRPTNIQDYLSSQSEILHVEDIQDAIKRVADADTVSSWIFDLSSMFPTHVRDRNEWLELWHSYENHFLKWCEEYKLDPERIICVQRVQQKHIGGLRLLPFSSSSKETIENHDKVLLERVSRFGLTATRVELDRFTLPSASSFPEETFKAAPLMENHSKEHWVSVLNSLEQKWNSSHPQKTLMYKGTLEILKDLCACLTQEKWEEVMSAPARFSAAEISFLKIEQQLLSILQEEEQVPFLHIATQLEQVHADISSLLEIFSPFTPSDFPELFRRHLTSLPEKLRPMITFGLHASAMTTLAGVFKTMEKSLGRPPHILYGENTYFECIHAAGCISHASLTQDATEEEWKQVELILAQFNPALKRIDFKVTEYHVEKIGDFIRKALSGRENRPLTVVVDGTLDFSNSPRVGELLAEFQSEIEKGMLNIICYRSGSKYDLFGMDNYCGAPFFMVHNGDAKWSAFDALHTDPSLQTDSLSFNWFCLAVQNAAPYLELYRKTVFDNTRALLNKIPHRLLNNHDLHYRIVPIAADADASFIDIKVNGPLHEIRGGLLVGVLLTVKCMEAGHPLFYRPSLGFYHPNVAVLFGESFTTVRLTLGLDPDQVDVMAKCFEMVDALNGNSFAIAH